MATKSNLSTLKNIGKTIEKRLNEVGIFTKEDLETVGPVEAWQRLQIQQAPKTLPICYYLYSLQGALLDLHWDAIPQSLKDHLKQQI